VTVWDVGAGSGSVAVECARFGARAVAIDRDPEQCARVRANAARHGVHVQVEHGTAPDGLADLPTPDAVFVGGGDAPVLAAVLARAPTRVVVALASVDRIRPVRDTLRTAGYDTDGCQLQSARLADLPNGSIRLAPANPVTLLWGTRPNPAIGDHT
jgi:precorrin-6Y C5,15-methyltransferase (decarboxylating)